ncbi:MAG: phosphoribosylformylglycinamidine cyclo-ligase [Coriobacteriales bacterium]|jgi:phosphoribosylformylglycinamidine cyclo-ligase|nr:phosphoribosylformylglycinamidine cyclo-ligase [Coriobacteriales bacterium]
MSKITYKDAGVDIAAGSAAVEAIKAAVESTRRPEVVGGLGGFGGLFDVSALSQMERPLLVSGTDGVGTKLELARALGKFDTVGIDLVAMCANDIVTCGARPLFFLDYVALERLEPAFLETVVEGIARGCRQAGCALIGGETAEHPGVMPAGSFDLSGFCVGVVDAPQMIGPERVHEGDVILGLASSGFHSNGYSLVRKVFEPSAELLAPTLMYVEPLLAVLAAFKASAGLHAAAHITGGGITNNLDRALPAGLDAQLELGSWPVPPLMSELAGRAELSGAEMLATFNMGIGMALVLAPEAAEAALALLDGYKQSDQGLPPSQAYRIGQIVAAPSASAPGRVVYRN